MVAKVVGSGKAEKFSLGSQYFQNEKGQGEIVPFEICNLTTLG